MSKPVINLIGRLGKDPEVIGEVKGLKFSLAVSIGKDTTDWYNITVWKNSKEFDFTEKFVKKGSLVQILGIQTLKKVEGGSGYWINIEAINIQFVPLSSIKKDDKEEQKIEEVDF